MLKCDNCGEQIVFSDIRRRDISIIDGCEQIQAYYRCDVCGDYNIIVFDPTVVTSVKEL